MGARLLLSDVGGCLLQLLRVRARSADRLPRS